MSRWALIRNAMLATTALAPFAIVGAAANPLGPNVVGGSATVSGTGTPSVTVNQATPRAIINWNSFNIGAGERTRFVQPGADSIALNRVTGGLGPSQLYGTLSANGRIFVVNPDGIMIGRGAVIDTAGFLATTNDITNENFMAGRYHFNIPGRPDASIVNEGTINAHSHGFAALVAPGVRNSGTITATYGKIGLAAGNSFSLDFYGDKLISLAVGDSVAATVKDVATGKPLNALVKNEGKLSANGGRVELTAAQARAVVDSVINNTGVIEARSIGHRNGKIVLGGPTASTKVAGLPTQKVKVSGKLDVSNASGKGGTIQVTGEAIEIKAASFDASGTSGGGKVLIGGDTGGGASHWAVGTIPQAALEASAVPNATTVSIDAATTINASATSVGDGGKVIVWADGATSFGGMILARGGDGGGNGGFVEVSGKQVLNYTGVADLRAPHGAFGTLLLDPGSMTIQAVGGSNFTGDPNTDTTLGVTVLTTALGLGNVIVQTATTGTGGSGGDIIVDTVVSWNAATTLTLSAYRDIVFNGGGSTAKIVGGGGANLILRADSTGTGNGTILMPAGTNTTRVDWMNNPAGKVTVYYNPSVFGIQDSFTGTPGFVLASSGQLTQFMLVNSFANLGAIGTNATTLGEKYALGRDIGGVLPFTGITGPFTGVFDGLNNTLSMPINGPALFGTNSGTIKNLNLNVTVTAGAPDQRIAALAGTNTSMGVIDNVHVTGGSVNAGTHSGVYAGGLVGQNDGDILNSSSAATVSGAGLGQWLGGLAGHNSNAALIRDSSASGNVTSTASVPPIDCMSGPSCPYVYVGGLVGNNFGSIEGVAGTHTAFATGAVTVGSNGIGGGLVGFNGGLIDNAMASGPVTGAAGVPGSSDQFDKATILGGLVGTNQGLINESKATGNVGMAGVDYLRTGGLVGDNTGLIFASQATGNVVTGNFGEAGGFIGAGGADDCMFLCAIGSSTASGSVTVGSSSLAGGFAATSNIIFDSHASGAVTGGAGSVLGGFVAVNEPEAIIGWSSATGAVTGTGVNSWIGGFVGYNVGIVIDSTASGAVSGTVNSILGGFAAVNVGWIDPSTANGSVNASGGGNILGGFAGLNLGTIDFAASFGAVNGSGPNNIVGGLVGANATFVNLPSGLLPFSTFPIGTVNNSTAYGGASGGSGSTVGAQIATTSPGQLPGLPAVLENCVHTICAIFRSGQFGIGIDGVIIPDEVLAVPNLVPILERLERFQPTDALIRIIPASLTTPGGPAGGTRPGSQVPGTPPRSLAPPPAYIRSNGLPSGLPPINETRFNPSQVLVNFPSNVSQAEIARIAQQFGLTVQSSSNTAGGVAVQFQLGGQQNVRNMIRALERLRELGTVQPNYTYSLVQKPSEPAAAAAPIAATAHRGDPAQYMTNKLHLNEAHRVASGNNVSVAVIDSEVDPDHAELAGTIKERFDATQSAAKPHSHGTAMAGAIVSRDRLLGVAPGARIMAVRAFSETQATAESTTFTILKGIEWAVSQGARVINMSFAGPYDPSLARALKDAADKGVILIAASGNAGPKSPPLWPGADPSVIAVTATDSGDKLFRQANRGPYVSVASPGVEILAPAPQAAYQMSTGTSIATAHVSGVVALMLERDPTLTPRDVRLILESTAADLGAKGRDSLYGWGLVNPARALTMVDERLKNKKTSTAPAQQR